MQLRFRERLAEWWNGERVLVGYSGGADSTCLLTLLAESRVPVVAAHLHHGQRDEADQEQESCRAYAEQLGIEFVTARADVPRFAELQGIGLEEAGRALRYRFFREVAPRFECPLTATGHTEDDLLETVFLNLARGTGLAGLAGIPFRTGDVVRPLLFATREETRTFCRLRGLWFHDDPSNADIAFSRARIRHRVLPEMELVHPGFRQSVTRLATIADEENRFLDGMAARCLEQTELPLNGALAFLTRDCEVAFTPALLREPDVLLSRALRLAFGVLGSGLDFEAIQGLLAALRTQPKGAFTGEGGEVVLEWTPDRLHARRLHPDAPFRFPLTVPGETESPEFGWKLVAESASPGAPLPPRGALAAHIDPDAAKGGLYFRSAETGDALVPLGMEGRRKVSDILGEMHLTAAARTRLPIVCDLVGPIWVPGGPLAERVKLTPESRRALALTLAPFDA